MGSREIPFNKEEICDVCGCGRSVWFTGGYLCPACVKSELQDAVDDGDFDDR
mgnify:CR=1 FL=1